MAWPRVRFPRSGGQWVGERDGVGFTGETDLVPVKFLVTSEALAQMLSPALGPIDSEMALKSSLSSRPIYSGPRSASSSSGVAVSRRFSLPRRVSNFSWNTR